jgi:hypothetical protein
MPGQFAAKLLEAPAGFGLAIIDQLDRCFLRHRPNATRIGMIEDALGERRQGLRQMQHLSNGARHSQGAVKDGEPAAAAHVRDRGG